MKKLLAMLLSCLLLTGCYSYKDMNQLLFFTMGVADWQDEQLLYYAEVFKGYRGEGEKAGKEKRVIRKGVGASISEAADQIRRSVDYPIEYAGNKSNVYCRALAERGLEKFLDLQERDQKPSVRVYMFIFDGTAQELMEVEMQDEQFTGLYLYDFMNSLSGAINVPEIRHYEYMEQMECGSGVALLPMIAAEKLEEDSGEEGQQSGTSGGKEESGSGGDSLLTSSYVAITGGAVMVKHKLAAVLAPEGVEAYKLLTSKVTSGLLTTPNPNDPSVYCGFSILDSKAKTNIEYEDGRIRMEITVNLKATLLEAQKGSNAGEKDVDDQLRLNLEAVVEERALQLFESMKEMGVDILNVRRELSRHYPQAEVEDILSITDFVPHAVVDLDGVGLLREAWY